MYSRFPLLLEKWCCIMIVIDDSQAGALHACMGAEKLSTVTIIAQSIYIGCHPLSPGSATYLLLGLPSPMASSEVTVAVQVTDSVLMPRKGSVT